MTWTLNLNNPLRADVIRMKDGKKLENRWFAILDGFVIVFKSQTDKEPTFYNKRLIDRIEGVHLGG